MKQFLSWIVHNCFDAVSPVWTGNSQCNAQRARCGENQTYNKKRDSDFYDDFFFPFLFV
jgi:hypothetical protein